ncbi:hypothetical protein E2562_002879 [Oryza meyeriana var. granulata]|uniref:Pectinesterase catalytic domain-containing protein n=1 Tax=Oryza meyeriana var. granulata TaxID=110450 RepID=A0A6G1DE16_9ORYZ|nr:hypothetical protein E2562_002879 [Oryza meyeriana var. granulata]
MTRIDLWQHSGCYQVGALDSHVMVVVMRTVEYLEYTNRGPKANTSRRVKWDGFHVITAIESDRFIVDHFVDGSMLVPFDLSYTHGL